jgi:hypothetical protein
MGIPRRVGLNQGWYYTFTMMSPYNDYLTLMSHFEKMLPGLIHRVHYENMVGDTAEQTRLLPALP